MKSILITLVLVSFVNSIKRDRIIACNYNVNSGPPSVIDANLCTHVLAHGFITMDSAPHHLVFQNYERNKKILDRLKGLKSQNTDLKIVAALECFAKDCYFDRIVDNDRERTDFVKNAIKLMREHKFNGLDLSWRRIDTKHKHGYSELLKELKKGLSDKETLSADVDPYPNTDRYVLGTMESLDFVSVHSFQMFGPWDGETLHHAANRETTKAMDDWTWVYKWRDGIPKNKLLLGIPFFGTELELTDESRHGMNAPIKKDSYFNKMPYNKICQHIKNGWNWEYATDGNSEPYAYKGKRWVSFEDPTSVARKAKWVRDNGYGGVAVWYVSQDDIDAKCSSTDRPLMRTIVRELFGVKNYEL